MKPKTTARMNTTLLVLTILIQKLPLLLLPLQKTFVITNIIRSQGGRVQTIGNQCQLYSFISEVQPPIHMFLQTDKCFKCIL